MSYEPSSRMKGLIRMLDTSPSMFHIKWPIGELSNDSTPIFNSTFELTTASGMKLSFKLQFEIYMADETRRRARLQLYDCAIPKQAIDFSKIRPNHRPQFLARLGLTITTNGSISDDFRLPPLFAMVSKHTEVLGRCTIDDNYGLATLFQDDDNSNKSYVVNCWLDVWDDVRPTKHSKGAIELSYEPKNYRRNSLALHSSDIGRLFDGIENIDRSELSDVVLITSDRDGIEHRLYCHRILLSARSTVFKSMFVNPGFEESKSGEVEIKDVDHSTMMEILKYIYTGQWKNDFCSIDALIDLMVAADKYALPELVDEFARITIVSGKYLNDPKRACLLSWAELLRVDWLKRYCLLVLSTNMAMFDEEKEVRGKLSGELWRELEAVCNERARETEIVEVKSKRKQK